jgi:hypothetical protein
MECCKSIDMGQTRGMTPMMHQMMAGHGEAAKLVDQLVASLAAIEAAKDRKARKQKLAGHGALLKELQTKLQAQNHATPVAFHVPSTNASGVACTGKNQSALEQVRLPEASFPCKKALLQLQAARITGQSPVRADHTVAWHDQRDRIL